MGGQQSILKHGGDKPISMDLSSFKKKSIQQTVSEAQLEQQMKLQEDKQNQIKKYKHWQDFDRLSDKDTKGSIGSAGNVIQNYIKLSLLLGVFLTRHYTHYFYQSQSSYSMAKKYYVPLTGFLIALNSAIFYLNPTNHPIHSRFFRETNLNERAYLMLDEQMDLYKYVDDIKYNFDYSGSNIIKTMYDTHKDYGKHMEKVIPELVDQKRRQAHNEI